MGRTGTYIRQQAGYRAFIPAPLPFDPPPKMDSKIQILLSKADRAIGRLDAVTELIPNPNLFVAMYVRREALYSSQIEGVTQASLDELLEYEMRAPEGASIANRMTTATASPGISQPAGSPPCADRSSPGPTAGGFLPLPDAVSRTEHSPRVKAYAVDLSREAMLSFLQMIRYFRRLEESCLGA